MRSLCRPDLCVTGVLIKRECGTQTEGCPCEAPGGTPWTSPRKPKSASNQQNPARGEAWRRPFPGPSAPGRGLRLQKCAPGCCGLSCWFVVLCGVSWKRNRAGKVAVQWGPCEWGLEMPRAVGAQPPGRARDRAGARRAQAAGTGRAQPVPCLLSAVQGAASPTI